YGLTSQMRRAAVSVPSNIAEGRGRFSHRELSQFLLHSRGSLLELETQLLLAARIGYLKPAETERLLSMTSELGRMLNGFLKTLQTHSAA
ncbi:MAG: four helix bundle protein, partial [Acidobacteria bacterium]